MRILLIEDNQNLLETMKQGLELQNYQVDLAHDGEEGEEKAFVNQYDCICLDLNLPKKSGLHVLKFLRLSQINTPVIIITARDLLEERTLGLDLGADDYLVKPIQLTELYARIRAITRRYYQINSTIKIGGLEIDTLSRQATYNTLNIPFSSKEYDILEYIAMCHPKIISTEEISEHVYDENFDPFSSVLRVHIARVRKKLFDASGLELLQTKRGRGYYLCTETKQN